MDNLKINSESTEIVTEFTSNLYIPPPVINPYLDVYENVKSIDPELQLKIRKGLIWAYSWAIPNRFILQSISEYSPIIELGAGTGYWAWLLGQFGVKVIAFDRENLQPPNWCTVHSGDESVLENYSDHALFLCWPSLGSKMALNALKLYTGSTIVYIGEWNGRTATEEFHTELNQRWRLDQEILIPNWPSFNDRAWIFKRL